MKIKLQITWWKWYSFKYYAVKFIGKPPFGNHIAKFTNCDITEMYIIVWNHFTPDFFVVQYLILSIFSKQIFIVLIAFKYTLSPSIPLVILILRLRVNSVYSGIETQTSMLLVLKLCYGILIRWWDNYHLSKSLFPTGLSGKINDINTIYMNRNFILCCPFMA